MYIIQTPITNNMNATDKQSMKELVLNTASGFAEAILGASATDKVYTNAFGRQVNLFSKGGLSKLMGMAISGMRSLAFITDQQLLSELPVLQSYVRSHIPLSLVVKQVGLSPLPQLTQSGVVVFQAKNAQELSDLMLIAQVVSEKLLCPVVVLSKEFRSYDYVENITTDEYIQWFGDPDGRVPDPSMAQEMVLGEARRRMPVWSHIDQPILNGAQKEPHLLALEKAARSIFEVSHYQAIIDQTLDQFSKEFKRNYDAYELFGSAKSKHLIVCQDANLNETEFDDKLWLRNKTAIIRLRQLNPIPLESLNTTFKAERIAVLEQMADQAVQAGLYLQFAQTFRNQYLENGWYTETPDITVLETVLPHLMDVKARSAHYWIDIPLLRDRSLFPKHEVLIQQIKRHYPNLESLEVLSRPSNYNNTQSNTGASTVLSRYANQGPPFAVISRFYDDTVLLYQQAKEELIADPFQAYPIMPMATGAFKDFSSVRKSIPVFVPSEFSAFDQLISSCAQGALPSAMLNLSAVLQSAIKATKFKGNTIGHIIPHLKKWTQLAGQFILDKKDIYHLATVLEHSFTLLLSQLKPDNDKAESLKQESVLIIAELSQLHFQAHQEHFVNRERREKGSGELFIFAVDPLACNGCGNCEMAAQACIKMASGSADLQRAHTEYKQFAALVSTSTETIERLIEDPEFESLAALLLNKDYYQSFNSSTSADQQNYLIRTVLAFTDYKRRAILEDVSSKMATYIRKISESVQQLLSNSLPMNRMNELLEILSAQELARVNLDALIADWGKFGSFNPIERVELEQKIGTVNELKHFIQLIKHGIKGTGRPSAMLVLDTALHALATYPYNSFSVPVVYAENNNTADLAMGMVEGQIRHTLDEIRLLRRAELEAKNAYIPLKHNEEIADLTWDNLNADEKLLAPPILVLLPKESLAKQSIQAYLQLISIDYPIRVCVIDQAKMELENLYTDLQWNANLIWPLMAQQNAVVARASFADRTHLFRSIDEILQTPSASFLEVLAPDASYFNIHPANWMQIAQLAVNTRSFIPFNFNPAANGTIASSTYLPTDLREDALIKVTVDLMKDGMLQQMEYPMSWADYAFMHTSFQHLFVQIEYSDELVFIDQVLEQGFKPEDKVVIMRLDAEQIPHYYAMRPCMVKATLLNFNNDKVFREWLSMFTLYPEKLKAVIKTELDAEYARMQKDFELAMNKEKKEWEDHYLYTLKDQLKETLLDMSGM